MSLIKGNSTTQDVVVIRNGSGVMFKPTHIVLERDGLVIAVKKDFAGPRGVKKTAGRIRIGSTIHYVIVAFVRSRNLTIINFEHADASVAHFSYTQADGTETLVVGSGFTDAFSAKDFEKISSLTLNETYTEDVSVFDFGCE